MDKLSILTVTKTSDMINQLWPKHDWKKKKYCTILLNELQLKEGTEYGSIIEIWCFNLLSKFQSKLKIICKIHSCYIEKEMECKIGWIESGKNIASIFKSR